MSMLMAGRMHLPPPRQFHLHLRALEKRVGELSEVGFQSPCVLRCTCHARPPYNHLVVAAIYFNKNPVIPVSLVKP